MRILPRIDDWRRWSVTALGVFLCGVIVSTIVITHIEWTMERHLQFAIPILFALGLTAYGGWLARSELPTERITRIAIWSLLGTVVIGSFATWEMYLHLTEGERFVATLHEFLLGGTEGAIIGGLVGYYDAKRVEQLHETKRAQQAVSASIDGIAVLDEDGRYTNANQAHADVYGYEAPEDFLGETWRMCYDDDKVAEFEEQILPILETEGEWRGETLGKRRDGSSFPQEVTLTALEDGGLVCVVRDISDRRAQERDLERKTDLLEKTQRMATVGGWELDLRDDELRWTDEIHRIYELPLDYEPELASALEFFHPEDTHRIEDAIDRAVEDGESFDVELRLITSNDNLRWVRARGEPRQEHGETIMLRGTFQDITERKQYENRLKTLHSVTREFLAGDTAEEITTELVSVAHNMLGYPLTAVWECDADTGQLVPLSVAEPARRFAEQAGFQELPTFEQGSAEMEIFQNDEAVSIEDYKTLENRQATQIPLGAVLFIPLGDHGLVSIGAPDSGAIDATDRFLGEILASNARAALDRAQREQSLTRRNEMIESLHGATRDMVGIADVEEICELAVDAAQRILETPNTAIWLSDATERRLDPITHSSESAALVGELPVYTPDGDSLSWQAFESGETRIYNDLQTEAGVSNPETPMRSEIIVPLGEYGVMNFGSQTSHAFADTDIHAAELLGASTVTALERADREQKLETQLDRMEFFNSILRHDVLNGMTVIKGRADFLTDELDGDQLDDAETILDWSDDIVEIVQRVRTTLDTLTSESNISLEPVELSETLQEELGRVRETYPEVTFETTISDAVHVQSNKLLSEVFGNIITNAVDHNETDGLCVSITATEQEDNNTAIVRIEDNGKGVADESTETIFRRDTTGHAKSSGSGFGLFFVDTMVDSYGGDVWVEDNEAGGATFVIELPLADATTPA